MKTVICASKFIINTNDITINLNDYIVLYRLTETCEWKLMTIEWVKNIFNHTTMFWRHKGDYLKFLEKENLLKIEYID